MNNQPLAYNVYSNRAKTHWYWVIRKGDIHTCSTVCASEDEAEKQMQTEITRMRRNDEITLKERFLALVSQEPSTWDKDYRRRKIKRLWNRFVLNWLIFKDKIFAYIK